MQELRANLHRKFALIISIFLSEPCKQMTSFLLDRCKIILFPVSSSHTFFFLNFLSVITALLDADFNEFLSRLSLARN